MITAAMTTHTRSRIVTSEILEALRVRAIREKRWVVQMGCYACVPYDFRGVPRMRSLQEVESAGRTS